MITVDEGTMTDEQPNRPVMDVRFDVLYDDELTALLGAMTVIRSFNLTPEARKRVGAWIKDRLDQEEPKSA